MSNKKAIGFYYITMYLIIKQKLAEDLEKKHFFE